MKGLIGVIVALALGLAVAGDAAARSSKGGSRPYYGGGKHSESHGGHYSGGSGGSSHKGGHYNSPSGGDRYGRHK